MDMLDLVTILLRLTTFSSLQILHDGSFDREVRLNVDLHRNVAVASR